MPDPLAFGLTIVVGVLLFAVIVAVCHRYLPETVPVPAPPPLAHLRRETVTMGAARKDELEPGVVADVEAVLEQKGW